MSRSDRFHLFLAAPGAALLGASASQAEDFPNKPIRIVVPYTAGGSSDYVAREVDDALAQAGRRNFILAPGCTLPSFSPKRSLTFLREHTRRI